MKKAKNLLLISVGVIFIGMIILYSCRSYTGPVKKVDGDKHADFVRYEFDGKDIDGKTKHVLVAFSEGYTGYKVMMSTDDFKEGTKGTQIVGKEAKTVGTSSEYHDVYPAITVLKDGTICTLAAENYDIIFRSFDYNYLSSADTNSVFIE